MTRKRTDGEGRAWQRWNEEEARAALAELASTSESEVGFARRKGVSTQRLRYWRKRLASLSSTTRPAFVAVTIPREAAPRPEVEVRIREVSVVVREGCDVDHAAQVVDAIARRMRAC
jgi:hypothetical protein